MITLLPRPTSLLNPVFATFIYNWQQRFNLEDDPYIMPPGEYYDSETDSDRFFSREELDHLKELAIKEYKLLKDRIQPIELPDCTELMFRLSTHDIFLFSIQLGEVMKRLSEYLKSEITFLLDYSVPWLHQKNDFKPVESALNYLQHQGVTEDFVGGIQADDEDLAELSTNLFWIIRCNASLPYCWFSSKEDAFVGDICKNGHLHFYAYDDLLTKRLQHFASKYGLIKIDDCLEEFGDGGIEGRQIIV